MTLASLPPWLPWWAVLAVAIPALVWLLLFLLAPIGVFGLKDRIDLLDTRLDEIQAELRALNQHLGGTTAAAPPPPPRPVRREPRFDWPR